MANTLGIKTWDYAEFYVGSARMCAYWFCRALGLRITGYAGPETGVRDRMSYYLTSGSIKIVVTSALQPHTYDIWGWVQKHGDGVKRWAIEVEDVDKAYRFALANGAVFESTPHMIKDENGYIVEAAMKIYDDTELILLNSDNYKGLFRPGFKEPMHKMKLNFNPGGLRHFDHIVGNVRTNEMNQWANYFNKTMDFETFIDFGPGDISTKYSALLSKVVRSKDDLIKMPINEPYEGIGKSQIEEYIEHYHGAGIQHIALYTDNILETIESLRENGVEFLQVPDTYYDALKTKNMGIREDLEELKRLRILCDASVEGTGYLLQLFTKPIGDRPTFFFEVIQRVNGAKGFGQGNFQALFEAIEQDQMLRGTLMRT